MQDLPFTNPCWLGLILRLSYMCHVTARRMTCSISLLSTGLKLTSLTVLQILPWTLFSVQMGVIFANHQWTSLTRTAAKWCKVVQGLGSSVPLSTWMLCAPETCVCLKWCSTLFPLGPWGLHYPPPLRLIDQGLGTLRTICFTTTALFASEKVPQSSPHP